MKQPKNDPNRIELEKAVLPLKVNAREVAKSLPGLFEGRVVLVPAGAGTADSLFSGAAAATLDAKLSAASRDERKLTVWGEYTDGRTHIPFRREMVTDAQTGTLTVTETADFAALPKTLALAEHSLELPLVVTKDEHFRLLAFGGKNRVEMFRMDMNDETHRSQSISDNRAFQPYWDIGEVLQMPGSYSVRRANHADTPAYPVEEGEGAPGWADYSELDWGITVKVKDAARSAPWAMRIDARKGTLTISPRPASQIPVSGADYGKREFAVELTPHETSWPTTCPCELPFETYKQLIDYLNQGAGYNHLSYILDSLGIGKPADRDTLHRNILFKERVQPSVMLRLLYSGDAWRMSGLASVLLSRSIQRNQTLDKWEEIAKECLEKVRRDGLPPH